MVDSTIAFAVLALGACSASSPGVQEPGENLADIGLTATPALHPDDVAVATVDGRPIWSSCVTAQALSQRVTAAQALAQCIDVDLLAASAAAAVTRSETLQQSLHREQRTALVSRLIAKEFEATFPNWESLPATFRQRIFDKNRWRLVRANYRESFFLRFEVPENVASDDPTERAAKQAADDVYATLKDRHGMFGDDLRAISLQPRPDQPGLKISANSAAMADPQRLVKPYADALFAIPQVGDVSPPTRTKWGWDIILFTDELTERTITEAQLQAELFPDVRLGYFQIWAGNIAKALQVKVQIDPNAEKILESTITDVSVVDSGDPGPLAPAKPVSP